MRLDVYLRNMHILKKRSLIKQIIEKGYVKINGKIAKPSSMVKEGDFLEIEFDRNIIEFKVLRIAEKPIPKKEKNLYFEVLNIKRKEIL